MKCDMKYMKSKKQNSRILIGIIISVICVVLLLGIRHLTIKKTAYTVPEGDYQAFFLSMFPVGNFSEEDFIKFRGLSMGKLSDGKRESMDFVLAPNEIFEVAALALRSDNPIDTLYLGIDPYLLPHTYQKDSGEVTFHEEVRKELEGLFQAAGASSISSKDSRQASSMDSVQLTLEDSVQLTSEDQVQLTSEDPVQLTFVYPFDTASTLASLALSSETALKEKTDCYLAFGDILFSIKEEAGQGNWSLYFPGAEEWLIDNPLNYEGGQPGQSRGTSLEFSGVPSILTKQMSQRLLLLCFCDGRYAIPSHDALAQKCQGLQSFVSSKASGVLSYPDLSDRYFLFLGDSILANEQGSCNVVSVFSALSGAHAANASQGGTPVVPNPDFYLNLGVMIDQLELLETAASQGETTAVTSTAVTSTAVTSTAIIPPDLSASCPVFASGLEQAAMDMYAGADTKTATDTHTNLNIVISLGINDCLNGASLDDFSFALEDGLNQLEGLYPNAQIYLTAPSYIDNHPGSTLQQLNPGGELTNYIDVIEQVASIHSVPVIDVYHTSGINEDNFQLYLNDGIHPGEAGRRMIALAYLDFFQNESER